MKTNRTELVFILDRSGSMSGLESDTIGGYNALLKEQRQVKGEATVTTVLFDDNYELLHDRINIKEIMPITEKDYYVRGCTALLDAIGYSIQKISNVEKIKSEEYKADKVLFVITTDGMENASREFGYSKIKQMIQTQKEKYGWEFIFLGANIDALSTAESFGISADMTANYHADSKGTKLNYKIMSNAVKNMRECGNIDSSWKDEIDKDFKDRKRKC